METLFLKKPIVRSVIYLGFAIITFIRVTPCIGSGIFLLFACIAYGFAQMNAISDANDQQKLSQQDNQA
jgi:hypothetical protein